MTTQTSAARIAPLMLEEAQAAAKESGVPEYMAELNVFRVLTKSPEAARGLNDVVFRLIAKGALDGRLRELLIMRIAWRTDSVYEWAQHYRIARGLGITDDELIGVRDWTSFGDFSAVDRAVLAATDDTIDTGTVSAETWADCAQHLNEAELIELTAAIGVWRLFSSLLRSLGVPLDDDLEPWMPDGVSPR